MITKKNVPKRQRSARTPKDSKKKQAVAAKRKHAQELAKARRQEKGKKVVAKSNTYAETQREKKTPLEIAHEVLVKNGYLPSALHATASATSAPTVNPVLETSSRRDIPRVDPTARNAGVSSSPKTLTKEQHKLIEERRQEALARRRRAQQARRTQVHSPVVIQPDVAYEMRYDLHTAGVPIHGHHFSPPHASRVASVVQPNSDTHRVVTPENIPTTKQVVDTDDVRPECFWDDLEAAAEIVQWENEHMAEVALEQPPAKTATKSHQESGTMQRGPQYQTQREPANTQVPAVSSLSQELLAAAEIIQWEMEHEISPEMPALNKQGDNPDSDYELDAPQFQLLPVHVTNNFEQQEPEHPRANNIVSHQDLPQSNSQPESKACPPIASPSSALRRSSAISSSATKPNPTSPYPVQDQPDPTTAFIDKHILEDKLEVSVLEFLNMMLA